ncbi:MAG: PAS domain S-box protein [Nitrospirota bacterium]|nr:PAS domain S-box protein [Nitrospirota bacterium]
MNSAQLLGYPLVPIAALELFLGLLLLAQNPRKSPVNVAIAVCSIAACLWSFSSAIMYIRVDLGLDYLLFARLSWVGWFTVPSALQSMLFLENEKSRKARIAGWVLYPFWTLVLALCIFTDLVVTDGYIPIPYQNSPGPLEMPFRLIGGLLVFWLIYEILRLRKGTTGLRRSQLSWYLYGTILFGLAGAVIGGFLQLFTGRGLEPTLSAYFSFPWVLMIFYSITRYRLFDIRLVLSRIIGALFLSIVISTVQVMLYKLLAPALGEFATITISITVIALALFGTPLGRRMQSWIHDILLRERFMYRRMLMQSSQAMISILQLDELLHFIVRTIREGIGAARVNIYLAVEGASSRTYSNDPRQLPDVLADRSIRGALQNGKPLIHSLLVNTGDEDAERIAVTLRQQDIELIVPLMHQGRLLGALSLGERTNGEPYVDSDLELLATVASQAAVAIENAQLFDEAARIRESLQKSEEKFRILADTLTAAIVIHAGGKLLYVNPAASHLTGYSQQELLAMEFWQLIHPSFLDLVTQRARARLHGQVVPQQYEFKVLHRDGSERWALTNTGLIEFEGKKSVIATLLDVTDKKRAEADKDRMFQESAHQYRARIEEQQRHHAEKEKIMKDLHDGVGGLTTNINLLAELARQNDDIAAVRKSLGTIADLSRESLTEIRTFLQSLDARELDWQAIAAEFRHLGNTIIVPHGIRFTLDTKIDGLRNAPSSSLTMNLFRIYKEALANVVKHSRAESVEVAFSAGPATVTLGIRDNGVGMNATKTGGRGLINMRSRAAEMGGTLTIKDNDGTHIVLEVPIP